MRSLDPKTRTGIFVASTEAVDRYGDVLRVRGWRTENYLRNPIFLWGHDQNRPIGKALSVTIEDAPPALVMEIQFASADASPLADQIFKLYSEGVLHGVSVGFLPLSEPTLYTDLEGQPQGWEYRDMELLELSAVSVPANPEALARVISKGEISDEIRAQLETKTEEPEPPEPPEPSEDESLDHPMTRIDDVIARVVK